MGQSSQLSARRVYLRSVQYSPETHWNSRHTSSWPIFYTSFRPHIRELTGSTDNWSCESLISWKPATSRRERRESLRLNCIFARIWQRNWHSKPIQPGWPLVHAWQSGERTYSRAVAHLWPESNLDGNLLLFSFRSSVIRPNSLYPAQGPQELFL